ncbi:hypothetical protein [Rhodococcus sp. 1R11]|uniref:hypothetical protein n=1 Tax=Rhodococcus sp. 1R11 TaxID=2559614 RepID=UPI001431B8E4|nr:hypothetical protein [Rhodococcus sp. 1R11]
MDRYERRPERTPELLNRAQTPPRPEISHQAEGSDSTGSTSAFAGVAVPPKGK